ncbi:transcription termination factor Rho [Oleiharenicola lentus]|uniref:transcription termination factor Rho n=1 Tax=Oleiharenicola lentus TaxID=2508720 RepID=UPI003F66BE04
MSVPPKSDEDHSKSDRASAESTPKRATRSRLTRGAPKKATKATAAAETASVAPAKAPAKRPSRAKAKIDATPELAFTPPPAREPERAPKPEPVREVERETPPPQKPYVPEPSPFAEEPKARAEHAESGQQSGNQNHDAQREPAQSRDQGHESRDKPQGQNQGEHFDDQAHQDQGGGNAHGGGGHGGQQGGGHFQQHGGQQQGGGGKFGRRHRERGNKFRGGQGGQGGGGGGGGKWGNQNFQPSPKHPPQPLPPKEYVHVGDLPDPARFQNVDDVAKVATDISSGTREPIWLNKLYALNLSELIAFARQQDLKFEGAPNRRQLITQIFAAINEHKIPLYDRGFIDQTDRNQFFVVHDDVNYRLYPEDAFLPEIFVKQLGLRRGHEVEVQLQAPQGNDRCPAVVAIRTVMGKDPQEISKVQPFEELVPYYPLKRIMLEQEGAKDVSMRMTDIITPVGFGQRGLIVAPPRTGKTVLMQNMANSIVANSPFAKLIILLVDERPEEVTDFKRHCKGEVVSSTFDETPESHVHCAEMVIEKARRLVEQGEHVVILLDSITRLARAYNALAGNSGKIMSGGLEANALQKPKRFFGSARNIEGAGSLTILGTALVDTGSRMDEIIFEEFKGTGNMELHLDRDLVNKRIFPAINIDKSGTRKEELIYHPDELTRVYSLRRAMQGVPAADSMDMLIGRLKKTKTNAEFLMSLNR